MAEKSYFRLQLDSTSREIERPLKAVYVIAKKDFARWYKATRKSPRRV